MVLPFLKFDEVIFFIHGGVWKFGDKSNNIENKLLLNKSLVSINYRLDVSIEDQINDIYKAYTKSNILFFGKKIIIVGHSAGAHLATMLVFKHNLKNKLISIDTKYDYIDKTGFLYKTFENYDKNQRKSLSPLYFENINNKSIMVFSSRLNYKDSLEFVNKFKDKNNIIFYPTYKTHKSLNEDIGIDKEYTNKILNFIEK